MPSFPTMYRVRQAATALALEDKENKLIVKDKDQWRHIREEDYIPDYHGRIYAIALFCRNGIQDVQWLPIYQEYV